MPETFEDAPWTGPGTVGLVGPGDLPRRVVRRESAIAFIQMNELVIDAHSNSWLEPTWFLIRRQEWITRSFLGYR